MKMKSRLTTPIAVALALAIPVLTNGCSSSDNPLSGACCTDFKVGADLSNAKFDVDASIEGQFKVLAQAASDFSVTAQGMLDDVSAACAGIAQDLGATADEQARANASTDGQARVDAWCTLAVAKLSAAGVAKGSLDIEPPQFKCEASVKAKADCQAKCSVDGKCDVQANPPTCEGGTLSVECSGKCTADAKAPSFQCKGSCSAAASGTCTAQGGVDCQGKCDGTCKASGGGGNNGIQADGTCKGTCEGTCSATAPGAKCEGTFEGQCQGTCEASGGSAKVECSGKCDAQATPLKCEGGTLKGGCQVDAKCDGNCDASVSAKASCDVQPFSISAKGNADAKLDAAIATLKVNLPKLVLAVKARGEAMGKVAATFTGDAAVDLVADPGKLGVGGVACIGIIGPTLFTAGKNAAASISAGTKVTGQVGL